MLDINDKDNLFLLLPKYIIKEWAENYGNGYICTEDSNLKFKVNYKPLPQVANPFHAAWVISANTEINHVDILRWFSTDQDFPSINFTMQLSLTPTSGLGIEKLLHVQNSSKPSCIKLQELTWLTL